MEKYGSAKSLRHRCAILYDKTLSLSPPIYLEDFTLSRRTPDKVPIKFIKAVLRIRICMYPFIPNLRLNPFKIFMIFANLYLKVVYFVIDNTHISLAKLKMIKMSC